MYPDALFIGMLVIVGLVVVILTLSILYEINPRKYRFMLDAYIIIRNINRKIVDFIYKKLKLLHGCKG